MGVRRGTTRLAVALTVAVVAIWGFACASPEPVRAAPGDFTVAPTSLTFPEAYLGESRPLTVHITNVSGQTLTPAFSGGAPLDSVNLGGSQNCAGKTFVPGDSCQFTYAFTPTVTGALSTTTTIGIAAEVFAITMSGTGLFPFAVAPTSLAFPVTPVGASNTLDVAITNISSVAQTPSFAGGAPVDALNFIGSQHCVGTTIAPGASCTFSYVFSPQSPGVHASSTSIAIDATNYQISLAGQTFEGTATPTTPPSAATARATTMPATTSPASAPVDTHLVRRHRPRRHRTHRVRTTLRRPAPAPNSRSSARPRWAPW